MKRPPLVFLLGKICAISAVATVVALPTIAFVLSATRVMAQPRPNNSQDASSTQNTASDSATTPAVRECPYGLVAVDSDGHCCSVGQQWRDGACAGASTNCLPGYVLGAGDGGIQCVPRACTDGRVRVADGIHCCWPGQSWQVNEGVGSCSGDIENCPEGTSRVGSACVPAIAVASVLARGAAPAGMVWVAGGTFRMGSRDLPRGRFVTLGSFWIDRTEVSAGAYQRCVAANRCTAVSDPFGVMRNPERPVVNVTWAMAERYCAWNNARLPTEAEWEFAARGADARIYPWGDRMADCSLSRVMGCGTESVSVSALPLGRSVFGTLNQSGNVAEWTLDRAGSLPGGSFVDPVNTTESSLRIVRGGSFESSWSSARVTSRVERYSHEARYDTGFRCVRSGQ